VFFLLLNCLETGSGIVFLLSSQRYKTQQDPVLPLFKLCAAYWHDEQVISFIALCADIR
jgi:hypothetical protein